MVVGNQLRLTLSLMHFKRAVNSVELDDFALGIEKMGKLVIPTAELFFQLRNMFKRIDRPAEFSL